MVHRSLLSCLALLLAQGLFPQSAGAQEPPPAPNPPTPVDAAAAQAAQKKPEPPQGPARPLAIIGGEPLYQETLERAIQLKTEKGKTKRNSGMEADLKKELITMTLFAQDAERKQLDTRADVAGELQQNRLNILARHYLNDHFRDHPADMAAVKADYERRKQTGEIVEYHVSQILLDHGEEALIRALVKRLNQGESFSDLAKEFSIDPAADKGGGDIGWVRPDIFIDDRFVDAMVALKPGEYTKEPVYTWFGWHIIRLEEGPRKVAELPEFDALPPDMHGIMQRKLINRGVEELEQRLRAGADIELLTVQPPAAAAAAAPAQSQPQPSKGAGTAVTGGPVPSPESTTTGASGKMDSAGARTE